MRPIISGYPYHQSHHMPQKLLTAVTKYRTVLCHRILFALLFRGNISTIEQYPIEPSKHISRAQPKATMTAAKTESTSKNPTKKVAKKVLLVKPGEKLKKKLEDRSLEKATNGVAGTELEPALVDKAVKALLKYHEKTTEDSGKHALLGSDKPIHVLFTLLRAPGKSQPKPVQILIPHPFFKIADREDSDGVEDPEICLIVKESSKPWCQEMIEKFPNHMGGVKKVLGLDSLRKKHSSYEQKRQLLRKYNMFMADDRILPMLSKLLGKAFIQAKRLPVPISLTREKALPFAIQKALSATYMTVNTGTCISIRAGHTGMDAQQLVENITAISKLAVPKIPRKWANVLLIGIKTADSISLPIYNKTPEALREIAKLAGIEEPNVNFVADDEEMEGKDGKKKRELKSPLLKALKKQKRVEKEQNSAGGEQRTAKKQKNSKHAKADDTTARIDEDREEIVSKNEPEISRKSPAASRQEKQEKSVSKNEETEEDVVKKPASATRRKKEDLKTAPASASKGKKDDQKTEKKEVASTPASASKGKKDDQKTERKDVASTPASASKGKKDNLKTEKKEVANKPTSASKGSNAVAKAEEKLAPTNEEKKQKEFMAATKFKGSKKGYVFRMGKQGLGYYVDVKPVVNKMAIEAITRIGKNQNRRGGQKQNKYKGTRRF
jgi:ribosome biogenesis protein UTP30